MPLHGDFAALRTLIAGLRPEQLRRPIVLGAQGALPRLMQEAIATRKTPAGKEWAPNVWPGRQRPLTRLAQGFTVEASPARLTVRNPHPGAGPLQYGRTDAARGPVPGAKLDEKTKRWRVRGRFVSGGAQGAAVQVARPFLPMTGLPREWSVRLAADGKATLRRALRAD